MNVANDKLNGFFRGQVIEHLTHGYCRIFIPGIYPEYFKQHKEMIPPAELAASLFGGANDGSGTFTYPNLSSVVWCFFANGDLNMPVYFASSLGGLNAFGQYQIIKTPNELCSTRHLITTGKTLIELFENGKAYCVVKDPDRRSAIVDYKSIDDITKIVDDQVSTYAVATSAENLQISSIECQYILDNDMSCHGMSQVKTQFYDIGNKQENKDYTLSIVNNYTMTNDGLVDIDSTSSYIGIANDSNSKIEQTANVKNNIDMTILSGISIQNSTNIGKTFNLTETAQKKESYNNVTLNDNGIQQQTSIVSVNNTLNGKVSDIEKSNALASYYHPGSIALCATYNKKYSNSPDINSNKNTVKTFELGNNILHAISSNISCNAILTVMAYSTVDNALTANKTVKYNVADVNAIIDNSNVPFGSNDHLMTYLLTSIDNQKINVNMSKHEGSDGNIITTMQYINNKDNQKQSTTASLGFTKDQGFNSNININVTGFGTNIKSSALRSTFASSTGSKSENSNNIVADGYAFDALKLTSKVNNFGIVDTDCTLESIHCAKKATYTEKITNNVGKEKCVADITINAKKGTIVLNIGNTNGESSSMCLDLSGNITLASSKTILLNAPLVLINGQSQVDIRSEKGVIRNSAAKVSSTGKAIWMYSPEGAIQIDSILGSQTL